MPSTSSEYRQLLGRNVTEYTMIRWLICGLLLFTWLALQFDLGGIAAVIPVAGNRLWLAAATAVLVAANTAFVLHHHHLSDQSHTAVVRNLITQVAIDLAVITVVVHQAGSVGTVAAFLYLPHVVLACIFFSRRTSLIVLAAAILLYGGCVLTESLGLLPFHYLFGPSGSRPALTMQLLHFLSVVVLWGMIWGIVSQLTASLHQCFRQITDSRRRSDDTLQLCQEQMRYTAHQMKSPLVAVQTNLMLLQHELGEAVSPRIKDILQRTDTRCRTLNQQVYDILNLARLKSGESVFASCNQVAMTELIQECVFAQQCHAIERRIKIHTELQDFQFYGNREALRMLLDNLVSNAVNYSHEDGTVTVTSHSPPEAPAVIRVKDQGIGMTPQEQAHIFEDFYRSQKAKQHCQHSTGMGLAIVKQVASMYGIELDVKSAPDQGSEFVLSFPNQRALTRGASRTADPAAVTKPDAGIQARPDPALN